MDRVSALDETLKKTLGAATAKVMAEHLDLHTVGDLLHHYPRRYARAGRGSPRSPNCPLDEHVTVVAQVMPMPRRPSPSTRAAAGGCEVTITAAAGTAAAGVLRREGGSPQATPTCCRAGRAMFAGKVVDVQPQAAARPSRGGYEPLGGASAEDAVDAFANQLIPIYPACKQLRRAGRSPGGESGGRGPARAPGRPADPLPPSAARRPRIRHAPRRSAQDPPAADEGGHRRGQGPAQMGRGVRPPGRARPAGAVRRRPTARRGKETRGRRPARRLRRQAALHPHREASRRSPRRSSTTSATEHPMHRLLQGEVGSGKTMVALRAMLTVVDAGGQAAMLAPTEVLAQAAPPLGHRDDGGARGVGDARRVRARHQGGAPDRLHGRRPRGRQALLDLVSGRGRGSSSAPMP